MENSAQMPLYQSHKRVYALQIDSLSEIDPDSTDIRVYFMNKDFAPKDFHRTVFTRFKPTHGDYYVVYDDGYESFSPRKAFEDGYTLV